MPVKRNLRPTETSHIFLDDQGRAWIDDTAYRVSMVVRDNAGPNGYSPEEICEHHYHELTLGQVHAALSYYYDQKAAIDAEIAEENRYVETLRAEGLEDVGLKKWSMPTVFALAQGPRRFSGLRETLAGISPRALAQFPDFNDSSVGDCNVGTKSCPAGAVDHQSVADQKIVAHLLAFCMTIQGYKTTLR